MIKKISAITIAIAAALSNVSYAAERKGPDLIVTDIRINNPYFQAGDDIKLEIDVLNIGDEVCESGWVWMEAKKGIKNLGGGRSSAKWSKKSLYPNEKMTWSIVDFVADGDETELVVYCDSAHSVSETNENNNSMTKTFKSLPKKANLEITDISVSPKMFEAGDSVNVRLTLKNSGASAIDYSEIDGEITSGREIIPFKTVQKLDAGEEVSFDAAAVTADGNKLSLSAEVNPEHIIDESIYTDNVYKADIHSVNEISYDWDSVRVGGGGFVPHMELHPTDPDSIYIGTDVGGSYRYDHSKEEWVSVTNGLAAQNKGYHVSQAIALDPNDSNIVYMALGDKSGSEGVIIKNGILRSFDKVNTWTDMNVPGTIIGSDTKYFNTIMTVDPNNSNILYAVCPLEGLFRTKNAKDKVPKWEKLNVPDFSETTDLAKMMSGVCIDSRETEGGASKVIYVSTRTGGIYRSEDGGQSFKLLEESPKSAKMMQVNKNGDLYACVSMADGGFVKYDGKNWLSLAPYKDKEYNSFAINPFDEKMIALSIVNDIYFTDNSGLTWSGIRKISDVERQPGWWPETYFASNLSFLKFDPINNKRLWFGDWFGVWRCDDITADRVSWKTDIRGLEEFCVRNIKPTSGAARIFIGAMDNCGVTSEDIFDFPNIQFRNPYYQDTNCIDYSENKSDIVARIGGDGWGSKDGNGGYSTDGGFTWQPFETYPARLDNPEMKASNGYLAVASDVNDDGIATIISTPINHYVYRSCDYGKTWTKIESLPKGLYKNFNHYNDPIEADSVNKDIFYVYEASTGSFYISRNNGESFEVINHLPKSDERNYVQALPGAEGCVYVAIGGEGIWHSEDYGKTFARLQTPERADAFSIGKEAPGSDIPTMYIYGSINGADGFYRSCDLGITWDKIKANTEKMSVAPDTLKADRKDFGVFYTVKGGNGVNLAIPSDLDIKPPRVVINTDISGKTVRENPIKIQGTACEKATVYADIDGRKYEVETDENGSFELDAGLKGGENNAVFYAVDTAGLRSKEVSLEFIHDPNYIDVTIDQSSGVYMDKEFTVTGSVSCLNRERIVWVNGNRTAVNTKTNKFSYTVPIHEGINSISVKAWDDMGNEAVKTIDMEYDTTPPTCEIYNSGEETDNVLYMLRGRVSENCSLKVGEHTYQIQKGDSKEFSIPLQLDRGENNYKIVLTDPAGNSSEYYASAKYEPKENVPEAKDEVMIYSADAAAPVIDGKISDGEWYMNRVAGRLLSGNTSAYAVFGLKGDSKYLYFAACVWDNNINFGTGADYALDTVELFFDPDMNRAKAYDSKDHQVRLGTLDGSVSGVKSKEGVKIVTSLTEDGYIVEAQIPWTAVDVDYAKGARFGFDVSINDNNLGPNKDRDGAFGWQGTANNYLDTSAFGTAIIE